MTAERIEVEFSRIFPVDRLGSAPVTQALTATTAECALLARRFGLPKMERVEASVQLHRLPGGDIIHVEGRVVADVVQTCVVTLEPFPSHVEDDFAIDFLSDSDGKSMEQAEEILVDIDDDPPEPIIDGAIDLGELVAQYLSLALDPYPRAPGVALESVWEGHDNASASPFAVLKELKRNS